MHHSIRENRQQEDNSYYRQEILMTTYHHIHDEIKDLNKKLFHFVELCEIKTRIAARRKLCPVCVNIDLNAVMSTLKYKDLPDFN